MTYLRRRTAAPAWAPTCGSSCGMFPKPPNPPTRAEQCADGAWGTDMPRSRDWGSMKRAPTMNPMAMNTPWGEIDSGPRWTRTIGL